MSSLDETIKIKKSGTLLHATEAAAGYDIGSNENTVLEPNQTKVINTNVYISIPKGYVGMICSRSGLAAKEGIFVFNSPGIIDTDYRGELKVILANFSQKAFIIKAGDRIAQLVLVPHCSLPMEYVDELEATNRGDGGLGSTGV